MDLVIRVNYKKGYENLGAYVIPLDDYENSSKQELEGVIKNLIQSVEKYPNIKSIKRVCLYQHGDLVKIIRNK